jgi:hypothetical protein
MDHRDIASVSQQPDSREMYSMIRYNIVQGDRTTAGGHVTGATDMRMKYFGQRLRFSLLAE